MNSMDFASLVIVLGFLLGTAETVCDFPETVPIVQLDGSTSCVCDTTRNYCGLREDTCYWKECDGNKTLSVSCDCNCPINYVEDIHGNCIPNRPPSVPVKCIEGEVILQNGQCGKPLTTTERATNTTASPTVPLNPPMPEVNVMNVTSSYAILAVNLDGGIRSGIIAVWYKPLNETLSRYLEHDIEAEHNTTKILLTDMTANTTYEVEVRTILSETKASAARMLSIITKADEDSQQTITTSQHDSPNVVVYLLVGVAGVVSWCIALVALCVRKIRRSLYRKRSNPSTIQVSGLAGKDVSAADAMDKNLDRDVERGNTPDVGDSDNQNGDSKGTPPNIYPRLSEADKMEKEAQDMELKGIVKVPTSTSSYQRTATEHDVRHSKDLRSRSAEPNVEDNEETKPLIPHSDWNYSDSSNSSSNTETFLKVYSDNYDFSNSYPPNDNSCSRSYAGLQPHADGHIEHPNTDDHTGRIVLTNQCDSRSLLQARNWEQPGDLNCIESQRQENTIPRHLNPQMDSPLIINSIQRSGDTQPISETFQA